MNSSTYHHTSDVMRIVREAFAQLTQELETEFGDGAADNRHYAVTSVEHDILQKVAERIEAERNAKYLF